MYLQLPAHLFNVGGDPASSQAHRLCLAVWLLLSIN